jgi:hypothetical protein
MDQIPVELINPLNAELNPICHLLALLGAHHILHINRIRVKVGGRIIHSAFHTLVKLLKVTGYIMHQQV